MQKQITIYVDARKLQRLEALAKSHGRTVEQYLTDAIEGKIKKETRND